MAHPLCLINFEDVIKKEIRGKKTIRRSGLLWMDGSADVHVTIEYRDRDHFLDGRLPSASKSG